MCTLHAWTGIRIATIKTGSLLIFNSVATHLRTNHLGTTFKPAILAINSAKLKDLTTWQPWQSLSRWPNFDKYSSEIFPDCWMEEIGRSPVDMVNYPMIYRVSYMSGGAGFLPSTVVYRPSPVFPHILTPAPHSLQAAHQAPPGSKWRLLIMNLQLPSQKLTWHQNPIPIGSMYGIFTYMNSETWPHSTKHVGKHTILGSYGIGKSSSQPFWEVLPTVGEFLGNDLGSCCLQKM